MAKPPLVLAKVLAELDAAVKAGDPAVAKSLRKGASAAALAKLAKVVGTVPAELATWFGWHDGQTGFTAIGPSTNHQLMTAAAAASTWKFLEDEGHKPWRSAWLPIMENGGGDHVVYDRSDGRLLHYWHDDKGRTKVAASLAAWATEIAGAWRDAVASTAPVPAPAGWARVDSPTRKLLAKQPAGTAYFYRATSPSLGKGVFVYLFWKQAKDAWFQATNSTLERCWTSISNNLLPFQAMPDVGAMNSLVEADVLRDGADAPHAGLYHQHLPTPPFPRKPKT